MVRNMDKAFKSGRIIQSMMGTGKIIRCADTAHMCGVMGTSIKANGLKIRWMAWGFILGSMAVCTLATISQMSKKDLGCWRIRGIIKITWGVGIKENKKDMVFYRIIMKDCMGYGPMDWILKYIMKMKFKSSRINWRCLNILIINYII